MTQQSDTLFLLPNPPFNGDKKLADAVESLMPACDMAVETGIWYGATARWFKLFKQYYGLELDPDKFSEASKQVTDAEFVLTDSTKWLLQNFNMLIQYRVLYFLDAHGLNDVPGRLHLEDEFEILLRVPDPIIVVHDYDDGYGSFIPGNTSEGPVKSFLERRADLSLYLCRVPLVVGACLICSELTALRALTLVDYWYPVNRKV